jgi:hypothetical protein
MPKITTHGGATNADEPGYWEDIQARQVDGVPAADSARVLSVGLRVGVSTQASVSALSAYQARLAELERSDNSDTGSPGDQSATAVYRDRLAELGEPPVWEEPTA